MKLAIRFRYPLDRQLHAAFGTSALIFARILVGIVLSFLVCRCSFLQASTLVYAETFEGSVGPEWSHTATDITPVGARRFLGQFSNDTVVLSLVGLPAHTEATVSFDLYIINSWDGNDTDPIAGGGVFGPDVWELNVSGGTQLLRTTYSNVENFGPTNSLTFRQAYPDAFPGGDNPPHTGAAEVDTLGYIHVGGDGSTAPMDSVYSLSFTFPHSNSAMTLNFLASGLQEITNESWGIDNVAVEIIPEPPTLLLALVGLIVLCKRIRTRLQVHA